MKMRVLISLLMIGLLSMACVQSTVRSTTDGSADEFPPECKVSTKVGRALTPDTGTGDPALACRALMTFFEDLNEGRYSEAAAQYGGSYEELIDMNPEADPDDHATLLEHACTINGFQCLRVKEVLRQVQAWPDTYDFTVEFANPDGGTFVLGACCGTIDTDSPPQSRFDFIVMRGPRADSAFRVQGLPVYVP